MRYKAILIRTSVKNRDLLRYGDSKEISIKDVDGRDEAKRETKRRAGSGWKIISLRRNYGPLDPNAARLNY